MVGLRFEPTLNWGHVLQAVVMLTGVVTAVVAFSGTITSRQETQDLRIGNLERQVLQLTSTIPGDVIESKARIKNIETLLTSMDGTNRDLLKQVTDLRIDLAGASKGASKP